MCSLFSLFLILCNSLLACETEWDDDELPGSSLVSYAGMSFYCDYGCGNPSFDRNTQAIEWLCSVWIHQPCEDDSFNKIWGQGMTQHLLLSPWKGPRLRYPSLKNMIDLEEDNTHEEFLVASSLFLKELEQIYIALDADLEITSRQLCQIRALQKQGYPFVEFDGDEVEGYGRLTWNGSPILTALKMTETHFKAVQQDLQEYERYQDYVKNTFSQVEALYRKIFVQCLEIHQPEGITFHEALEHFTAGEYHEAIEKINFLITLAAQKNLKSELIAKLYLLKGQVQSEVCLYSDAVITLTEAIQKNPAQKQAFFERAIAYFELGDFDRSLEDYLSSNMRPYSKTSLSSEMLTFALGLRQGVLAGGAQGLQEFIPSMLASFQGLGHGLWAFAKDPIQVSSDLIQAAYQCVQFVLEHTPEETISRLVPEFGDLFNKWDLVGDKEKGEMTGHLIGKYGVEIFSGISLAKGMKAYHNLKKADHLLTLEAMAISRRNQEVIRAEAIYRAKVRKTILKTNLTIKPDAQGKHIVGHRNYEPWRNRSIAEHPNLQELVNKFAGTGIKDGAYMPGCPGYKEIIDFGEFIGYFVRQETGEQIATNWGKIYYAKNGTHVVPIHPREFK